MLNLSKRLLRRMIILTVVPVTLLAGYGFVDEYFEVSKQLDVFSTMYRELNLYYVDPTDPGKLMRTGMDAMLKSLDPYTTFIPESEMEDFRFLTTGQYGGIGAVIRQKGDEVVISEPYEGFPAQRADLRAGDVLLEVDGHSLAGKKTDEVSRMLKGAPGTTLVLTLRRPGMKEPMKQTLIREEINVKNVPFYTTLRDSIGYLKLTGFTENASKNLAAALAEMEKTHAVKGLILDLRGNPGGLLQEAVNVSNLFLPKGELIVSTKGRMKDMDRSYAATQEPVAGNIPVVVLVNSGSASASEIVSGALQDLDRAVIVGQRTYGKGLVQSTRPLSYNAQLKLTTAKYYIPSGRCIQAVDYSHRNADGSVGKIPDSLMHTFQTRAGRTVMDGGGILPDVITTSRTYSPITGSLLGKSLVFDYATYYRTKHDSISQNYEVILTSNEWLDFQSFIHDKEYDYRTKSESSLDELKKNAQEEAYLSDAEVELKALSDKLEVAKQKDLEKNRQEILSVLEEEIATRYGYQQARYRTSIQHDEEVTVALEILGNPSRYDSLLSATKLR